MADTHLVRACAVEMHFNIYKSHCIPKFTRKMPRPRMNPECTHTFCGSLRNGNALQHVTGAATYDVQEHVAARNRVADFARACASEAHVNFSHGKNAAPQSEHPDQAPAFTLTVKPFSVDTLFGEKIVTANHAANSLGTADVDGVSALCRFGCHS